ncbi:MAG: glycosyltransferase family 2 protein [Alphaproteobacteria bacterium]|nr:glycosyltransferase family 2 protein [Alphaproteobacteria bacterium]
MISIVIPAYNEEHGIADTVIRARAVLESFCSPDYEVIVVDDGSSDSTADIAAANGATVIRKLQNLGYGNSLKLGISQAKFDTIVITDADGTYPIEAIPELVDKYKAGYHMVVGARTGQHYRESILKGPLRAVLKWLVEFTAGRNIPDINSGLRVFSKQEAVRYFDHLCDGFSFTTSITLAYMLKMKFVEYIPITYSKRVGKTKVKLFRDSLRTLQFIVQAILYYNPMKIFIVLSAFSIALGLLMAFAGFFFHLITAALLGVGGILVGVVIFALGLLAELLRQIWVKD